MRYLPPENYNKNFLEGFGEDFLGRKKVGQALLDIILKIEDPLVIAVDGKWGTGKSFFLKQWMNWININISNDLNVIYFDAFAHDYIDDPLISITSAVSKLKSNKNINKIKKIKSAAIRLAKPVSKLALNLATIGVGQYANDFIAEILKYSNQEGEKAIDEFWAQEKNRESAMEEFRSAIESFTVNIPNGEHNYIPLVFIVDELDRCRPDYALRILEIIKHLFSVERVHFILGVNLTSLESSVKMQYGAEIEARDYLKKFINLRFELPDSIGDADNTPAILRYLVLTGNNMGIPDEQIYRIKDEISFLSHSNSISLRDIGSILSNIVLVPENIKSDVTTLDTGIIISMVIMNQINPQIVKYILQENYQFAMKLINEYYGDHVNYTKISNPNGNENPTYNDRYFSIYYMWMYVLTNGSISNSAIVERIKMHYGESLDRPMLISLPKEIYIKYLDFFKRY